MLIGVGIKIGILICLITAKGPIKGLIYIWGGTFIFAGVMGLLSLMLSPDLMPVQEYFNKSISLIIGVVLVALAGRYIIYLKPQQ
jgi:hypothetical protein